MVMSAAVVYDVVPSLTSSLRLAKRERTMRAGLAVILALIVIAQTCGTVRAAESSPAGVGVLTPMVGQGADIAPSAYFFRADCKLEENPPEAVFLIEEALKHAAVRLNTIREQTAFSRALLEVVEAVWCLDVHDHRALEVGQKAAYNRLV